MPYVIQLGASSWYAGPSASAGLVRSDTVRAASFVELAYRYEEWPSMDVQILQAKGYNAEVEVVP